MEKSLLNSLVDNVYVLNLEKDLNKYDILKKKLGQKEIDHQRFVGIDGYEGPLSFEAREYAFRKLIDGYRDENLYKLFLRRGAAMLATPSIGAYRSSGAMGCVLSNIELIQDALDNKYEKILIFQDDIYFHKRFDEMLNNAVETVKSSDVFYLGASEYNHVLRKRKWTDPNWNYERVHYPVTRETCGMYGVVLSKKMFDPLLKLLSFKFFPADTSVALLAAEMFPDSSVVAYPNLIIPDQTHSRTAPGNKTPENKRVHMPLKQNYTLGMGWDLDYYEIKERYCG